MKKITVIIAIIGLQLLVLNAVKSEERASSIQKGRAIYEARSDVINRVVDEYDNLPKGINRLLWAICMVETQGESNNGEFAKADYSRKRREWMAIGPFCIWEVFYMDAIEFNPKLRKLSYNDCNYLDFSTHIVISYWKRYSKDVMRKDSLSMEDLERLARQINGGPTGHTKTATEKYWIKVKELLEWEKK
jgi:hypothetical protein